MRYVIPDIHGCLQTLQGLVSRLALSKTDSLYFLGDYIDRGKDSGGVLDYILNLMNKGYTIYPLLGNHEFYLLEMYREYKNKTFQLMVDHFNKSASLLDAQGNLKSNYLNFLEHLPYYYELDDCFLVHGGFNTRIDDPFSDTQSMLERKNTGYNAALFKNKAIIHGHQVKSLHDITKPIEDRAKIIPLDNGCVFHNRPTLFKPKENIGNLVCLNIDTYDLIIQPNIET